MNSYKTGKTAEFLARMFLRCKGYRIICKNFGAVKKMNIGEIDFIALKNKTVVFVEVKNRKSMSDAAYAISPNQQKRIIRGAQNFLKHNPKFDKYDKRFDAVLVVFPFYFKHIKNAWMEK